MTEPGDSTRRARKDAMEYMPDWIMETGLSAGPDTTYGRGKSMMTLNTLALAAGHTPSEPPPEESGRPHPHVILDSTSRPQ